MAAENILIDMVRISGFRGIENLEAYLSKITVLIGCNNSGKTTILKALQLALGDYSRSVSEEDFHVDSNDNKSDEIIVDVRIIAVDPKGNRVNKFPDEWMLEFTDSIQAEANGSQFLAVRTRAKPNEIKGGFDTFRFTLEKWLDYGQWLTGENKETKASNKFIAIPFIAIEAQRDIHNELRDRHSFAGKILSAIDYDKKDVDALESLIENLNEDAVKKSATLEKYKVHLSKLHQSFDGSGSAEITPFPKKIRDFSKHFSVQFGESKKHSFSMEYHGMGTRSWASMLTMKAFIELVGEKHEEEKEAFYPFVSAEEPEAHLHPNAQKTLYQQLSDTKGQIVISTHSPYLAAMAHYTELRCVNKKENMITVQSLTALDDPEDQRKLHREIIHSRGEVLFSKALILCEGETEEQALPLLFCKYFGVDPFALGINFIGVKGAGNYLPFLRLAKDFSIPAFIFSDGEPQIISALTKHYSSVFGQTDITNTPNITVLDDNQDFEDYLMVSGFDDQVESAINNSGGANVINNWISKKEGTPKSRVPKGTNCSTCSQPEYTQNLRDYNVPNGRKIAMKEILDSQKTKYAVFVAEELCKLDVNNFPPKIVAFFNKIKTGMNF